MTVTTRAILLLAAGIELLDLLGRAGQRCCMWSQPILQGNLIWYYDFDDQEREPDLQPHRSCFPTGI